MTIPAFGSKGTANNASVADGCTAITNITPACPATVNASDILLLLVNADTSAGGTSVTSISLPGGWTILHENGGGTQRMVGAYYKVADGTEDSATVSVDVLFSTGGAGRRAHGQVYSFSGSGTGLVDTGSGGASSGSSTTASLASLTTGVSNELGVAAVWANSNVTVSNSTGETGGDWTEAAAEDQAGTTSALDVQTVSMASAGTVSGGACTLGSSTGWRTFVFALKELVAAGSLLAGKTPMQAHHIFR